MKITPRYFNIQSAALSCGLAVLVIYDQCYFQLLCWFYKLSTWAGILKSCKKYRYSNDSNNKQLLNEVEHDIEIYQGRGLWNPLNNHNYNNPFWIRSFLWFSRN